MEDYDKRFSMLFKLNVTTLLTVVAMNIVVILKVY